MRKHVVPNMTPAHSQSVIRHLVSANVLLKEQLDKQTDERKQLRKKLLQAERDQNEKDRALASKQKELDELRERVSRMQEDVENQLKCEKQLVNAAQAFKSSPKPLTSTPKSII